MSIQQQPSETGGIDKKPTPILAPGGGLDAHEAMGGHLLKRHVGKTEKELLDRFINEPKIIISSAFFKQAVAEEAAAATITANQEKITFWLAAIPPKLVITSTMNAPAGLKLFQAIWAVQTCRV